jgi:hypothetical protein
MESERKEITASDLAAHSRRHGRKATSQLLEILGRRRPHYELVTSPGGQLMFSSLLVRMDELVEKIVGNKATEEERVEYKVSVDFLNYNADIMTKYEKHSNKLKGVG